MSADIGLLEKVGFTACDANAWLCALPELGNGFDADGRACSKFWSLSENLRSKLPPRAARTGNYEAAGELIHRKERDLRERFLSIHVDELYAKLTSRRSKFLRVDQLMTEAATLVPGLTPGVQAMAVESLLPLKEKEGFEIDHGILLAHILAHRESGHHLCHAMLLPRREALELLQRLAADGSVDLGATHVSHQGKASIVELRNVAGREDFSAARDGHRSCNPRSKNRDRNTARRDYRSSEVCWPSDILRRHQSHPSL